MKPFIDEDFLLHSGAARDLYLGFARGEPIYDYHCHVPPEQIALNHRFADLSEIWLGGDHYKWRAMRANGVDERFCTGDAAAAREVRRLGRDGPAHAVQPALPLVAPRAAAVLRDRRADQPGHRRHDLVDGEREAGIAARARHPRGEPRRGRVHDRRSGRLPGGPRHDPALGPDDAGVPGVPPGQGARRGEPGGLQPVGRAARGRRRARPCAPWTTSSAALRRRHDDFHVAGGRLSDHGLDAALAEPCTHAEAAAVFKAAREGRAAAPEEAAKFGSFMMLEFGRWDARRGWTKQLHLGALREVNTRLLRPASAPTRASTR